MLRTAIFTVLALVSLTVPGRAQSGDTLLLSLPEAVTRALRTGDEALLAQAQVDVAEAQLTTARAAALPQLRFSGSYTHVYASARGQAVGAVFNQPNTYSSNLNLSQPLFQGGRAFAGLRAARHVRSAAQYTAEETRIQVALDVQDAYLAAMLGQRVLDIRAAALVLSGERLAQVRQLAGAGRASRYEVLRASVERANIEPTVIDARGQRDVAILALKRLTNVPATRPVRLTTVLDGPTVERFASLMRDTAQAAERAALRAAAYVARARHDAIAIARADLLPTVSIFLQSGYQAFPLSGFPTKGGKLQVVDCPAGSQPGRVCTQQNGGWFSDRQLGVQVSWPIFDGFRTRGQIALARAQARIADLQLAQEREVVAIEIARARAEVERTRALYDAQLQGQTEAREAFQLASLRFTRGLGTQLEVSDAQLALLTAQTNQARAVFDLYLATAELARAMGRPLPLPDGTVIRHADLGPAIPRVTDTP